MRFLRSIIVALPGITFLVAAAPAVSGEPQYPDGFPNPNPEQLKRIEHQARGMLPNGPLPSKISQEGILSLKWIAFNEIFEAAYFTELLRNVTNNVPGYRIEDKRDHNHAVRSLTAIRAQEELHAISANAALKNVGVRPIQPCKHYMFPVSNYKDAVTLAAIFTDLVMGTLQDTIQRFAEGGDVALARFISSVVGQEGEQDGWYRVQQGKIPSQLPFLTTSELGFAFSYVLQRFTRPDLCPSIKEIPLPIFPGLYILTPPGAETQKIKVAWHNDPTARAHGELFITYINQQNLPVSEPLRIVAMDDMVVAEALFPYDKYLMNGLTIATITKSGGPFPDAQAVLKATLFGPGLIDFN